MFDHGGIYRQFVVSMIMVVIFAVISLVVTDHFFRQERRKYFETPAEALAKNISESGLDPDKFAAQFNEVTHNTLPFTLKVLSEEDAQSLGTPPQDPFEAVTYYGDYGMKSNSPRITVVRLNTPEKRYLELMPKHTESGRQSYFVTMLGALVISALLAMFLALSFLYTSLKRKTVLAEGIIEEIKGGNLKARFPITTADRLSQNMVSFNKMADEIEGLVERLKQTEQARMVLLQQLAHDLRTPIASLKNLLETIHLEGTKLDEVTRDELTGLSLKEATYFERLVEDLLFLAQVSEPKYTIVKQQTSLTQLLEEQADLLEKKYSVKLEKVGFSGANIYAGDKKLLERLFRNSLENAMSFAKSFCRIEIRGGPARFEVTVFNDGTPMTADEISSFGQKKNTRLLSKSKDGRVSVGMGSVIMETIARAHGGNVIIRNVTEPCPGVELKILLKD